MARLEVGIGATNKELKSVLSDSQTLVRNFSNNLQKINLKIGVSDRIDKRVADTRQSLRALASTAKEVKGIKIDVSIGNAINELKGLNAQLVQTKKLYGEIRNVISSVNSKSPTSLAGGGSKAALDAEKVAMAAAKREAQLLKNEYTKLNNELKNLAVTRAKDRASTTAAAGSYREAQQRLTALGNAIRNAAGGFNSTNPVIQAQIRQYRELNDQLKRFDTEMGNHQRKVGNYTAVWGGLGGQLKAVALGYVSVYAAMNAIGSVVRNNIRVSDTLSDVQRTADLTKAEVSGLVNELKRIPTRTGLNELLEISVIGGQLGIAKNELAGFVQALDFLGVALAKEIPGGAEEVAESLGKINGVFRIAETEGLTAGQAMQKTGSAILALGQAGLATGGFLVDFTQRVGGAARTTGIALPTILAYGATLEEAGVSAEVAGTAISKLIGQLAAERADFHAISQIADSSITLQQFTDLINTDADAALRKFFAGLAAGGKTTTQFYDILNSAGIKTERYRNAVLLLAQDQEKLSRLTALSTKEYISGANAAEQFELRNLNLAGALSQVGRKITEAFVQPAAQSSLARLIAAAAGLTSESDLLKLKLDDARKGFSNQLSSMVPLINEYRTLTENTKRTKEESGRLKDVIREIGTVLPGAVTQWDEYGAALSFNIAKVKELTDVQRVLMLNTRKGQARAMEGEFNENHKELQRLVDEQQKLQRLREEARQKGVFFIAPRGSLRDDEYVAEISRLQLKLGELAGDLKDIRGFSNLSPNQKGILEFLKLDPASQKKLKDAKTGVDDLTSSVQNLNDAAANQQEGIVAGIERRLKELREARPDIVDIEELKENTRLIKELETHLNQLNERTARASSKGAESAILSAEQLSRMREAAHVATLSGWEKELQASKYRWASERDNARDSIEQILELRRYQAAETARILQGVGMETSSGRIVLKPEPVAIKGLTQQLNLSMGEIISQDWSTRIAEKYKEVNAPKLDWSDFSDGLKRVTNQFTRNMMGAIDEIGGMTEKKGRDVVGLLGSTLIDSFSGISLNVVSNKLQKHLNDSFDNLGEGINENAGKWLQIGIAGAGLVGQGISGASSSTNVGAQAVGGLLKGAAAGASFGSVVPVVGTAIGAAIGAALGGISGWLQGKSAENREQDLLKQSLEEQKKQTEMMRRNALSYTAQIIGQQTNQGIVTNVDRDEFGNVRFRIEGKDLVASLSRTDTGMGRGI